MGAQMILTPRAELALTLARAFLPPGQQDTADSLLLLSDDLEDLGAELTVDLAESLIRFRQDCRRLGGSALLVHYSRLFLSPPLAARLNLGWYLDGSLNGPLQDALARWFAAHSVGKAASFHDLGDHLAVLLEFVGLLESQGESAVAREFVLRYLLPALPGLERDVTAADAASPYASLLSGLHAVFAALYPQHVTVAQTKSRPFANRADRPDRVHCTRCGAAIASARDLAVMRKALESSGLPAAHLDLCPDCREAPRIWEQAALHGNA